MHAPLGPGCYLLCLYVPCHRALTVGSLGMCRFDAGWYLYVGSALGGLGARLARHMRREKRLHWHVDYLLAGAEVAGAWYTLGSERRECAWSRGLSAAGWPAYVRSFGASDCACRTHLFHAGGRPTLERLHAALGDDLVLAWYDAAGGDERKAVAVC